MFGAHIYSVSIYGGTLHLHSLEFKNFMCISFLGLSPQIAYTGSLKEQKYILLQSKKPEVKSQ